MALPNFKSLEVDGFIVLKNAIDPSELELLRQEYAAVKSTKENKNYYVIYAPKHSLSTKIKNILNDIAQTTSIKLDTVNPHGEYFDTDLVTMEWHQDYQVFYKWQDAINSLNFWIPLVKPNSKEDGVMILPHGKLKENFPEETAKHIIGKGAQRFYNTSENQTTIFDDNNDEKIIVDGNIFDFKVVPEVEEGDILILRGDCIHKTDENNNNRIALSIRCIYSKSIIDKQRFLLGGETKKRFMKNDPRGYRRFFKKFEQEPDRDTFTVAEIQSVTL